MSPKQLVKLSNTIGIIAILLLIYWVFTFVTIEVFGLKVFREDMTQTFYLSILGILALMAGALIVNIMFNLTRIAEHHDNTAPQQGFNKKLTWALVGLFPLIGVGLFAGNYITLKKKEQYLIQSARSILETNTNKTDQLLNYQFTEAYINTTAQTLDVFTKTDTHFPTVSLIVKDTLDKTPVFLAFNHYSSENTQDTILPKKEEYIKQTNQVERKYLQEVFNGTTNDLRYTSHEGNYELFYPYKKANKIIVLYFSDHQRYGK